MGIARAIRVGATLTAVAVCVIACSGSEAETTMTGQTTTSTTAATTTTPAPPTTVAPAGAG